MRKLWFAGWAAFVLLGATFLVTLFSAILLQNDKPGGVDEKFAGVAGATAVLDLAMLIAMASWTSEKGTPKKQVRLTRAARHELREKQQRVELDRRIAEMEREFGIRGE